MNFIQDKLQIVASVPNNLPQYILLQNLKNIFLELMSKQIKE